MVSFVREKKWMSISLSVVRRGPDNASEACGKRRDQKMSQFLSPEAGTSLHQLSHHQLSHVMGRIQELFLAGSRKWDGTSAITTLTKQTMRYDKIRTSCAPVEMLRSDKLEKLRRRRGVTRLRRDLLVYRYILG